MVAEAFGADELAMLRHDVTGWNWNRANYGIPCCRTCHTRHVYERIGIRMPCPCSHGHAQRKNGVGGLTAPGRIQGSRDARLLVAARALGAGRVLKREDDECWQRSSLNGKEPARIQLGSPTVLRCRTETRARAEGWMERKKGRSLPWRDGLDLALTMMCITLMQQKKGQRHSQMFQGAQSIMPDKLWQSRDGEYPVTSIGNLRNRTDRTSNEAGRRRQVRRQRPKRQARDWIDLDSPPSQALLGWIYGLHYGLVSILTTRPVSTWAMGPALYRPTLAPTSPSGLRRSCCDGESQTGPGISHQDTATTGATQGRATMLAPI